MRTERQSHVLALLGRIAAILGMLVAVALLLVIAIRRQALSVVVGGTTNEQREDWKKTYPSMSGPAFVLAIILMGLLMGGLAVAGQSLGLVIDRIREA